MSAPAQGARRLPIWRSAILEVLLVAACVVLAIAAPEFATLENAGNILRSVAEIGVIAFGMTMVIIAGEIDLSAGSTVAFAGCLTAWLVAAGAPLPVAMAAALGAGALSGATIGALRTRFAVPSFITSLALLTILRGVSLKLSGGFPMTPFPAWFGTLGGGRLWGVPVSALIFAAVFLGVLIVMDHTVFGRMVYAVGGNAEAARLSGVPVARIKIAVLAITGCLAALSGLLLSSRLLSSTPTVAVGWELDVIAAVIVGGTSLSGGTGRVWGSLVGVLFIGVIVNGMRLLDVPEDGQLIARGAIVLFAVLLSRVQAGNGKQGEIA